MKPLTTNHYPLTTNHYALTTKVVFFLAIFSLITNHYPLITSAEGASKGKGPVLHMRFDEGGGATAYDDGWTDTDSDGIKDSGESWNNNDGTLTPGDNTGSNDTAGEMWSRQGKIGSAFECDGTNDYINCGNNSSLTMTDYLTVEAWIKGTTLNNQSAIVARSEGRSPWNLGQYSSNTIWVALTWSDDTYQDYHIGSLTAGTWHHIAFTFSYNTGSVKIYQDGKVVGDYTKNAGLQLKTTTNAVYIGGNKTFDGLIDEVKIYDYARTAAQVMVDYNAGMATHSGTGVDPNEGNPPVVYLDFDENTGATVYDRSGNDNNGSITGASWVQGKHGSALSFNGSSDNVTITNLAGDTFYQNGTISFWLYLDRWAGIDNVFGTATNNVNALRLEWDTGLARFIFGNSGGSYSSLYSTKALPVGIWQYVTLTWNQTANSATVYLNGKYDNTTTGLSGVFPSTFPFFKIGTGFSGRFVDGKIDDVKIYDYARTAAQIAYDYNRGKPVAHYRFDEGGGTIAHNSESSANDGAAPVGWWRMDEASWNGTANEVVDSSGNANHGVRVSTATTSSTSKIGPYCGTFNGTNDYVNAGNASTLNPTTAETIEAWVKFDVLPSAHTNGYPQIIGKRDVDTQRAYFLSFQQASDQVYWELKDESAVYYTLNSTKTFVAGDVGQWFHIAVTFDGAVSSNNTKIYINGVLDKQGTWAITYVPQTTAQARIGGGSYWLDGSLDDVRLYNYARTAEQIYNDYKTTHGTMVGDTKFVDGKIGKALSFDGTGDYVNCGTDASLDITGDTTISVWVKTTSTANQDILRKQTAYPGNGFLLMCVSNKFEYYIMNNNTAHDRGTITINDGNWHHLGLVLSGNDVTTYVDGALDDTLTTSGLGSTAAIPLTIGGTSSYFNGQIDDLKIYDYSRTAAQISKDYNAGMASHTGVATGVADPWGGALPVGHWRLDENTGVLARDSSENAYDGTLGYDGAGGNVPSWTQGKNGPCLDFDGGDYVEIYETTAFDLTDFTYTAWINFDSSSGWRTIVDMDNDKQLLALNSGNYAIYGRCGNVSIAAASSGWHHLAWVVSGANYTVYEDGVQIGSGAGCSASVDTSRVMIGAGYSGADSGNEFFDGRIDDVRVYNYALTQAQVAWLYNRGAPVAHYRFDESSGTSAFDDTGNYNATVTIGATGSQTTIAAARTAGATGKYGRCMSFDGTDDYMATGYGNAMDPSLSPHTFSAWVKADNPSASQMFLATTDHAVAQRAYFAITSGKWDMGIQGTGWGGGTIDVTTNWTHVAIVMDGSTASMYVNGVFSHSKNYTSYTLLSDFNVGRGNGYYWDGLIDDVRIYNYARTTAQIMQDYNQGLAAKLSD